MCIYNEMQIHIWIGKLTVPVQVLLPIQMQVLKQYKGLTLYTCFVCIKQELRMTHMLGKRKPFNPYHEVAIPFFSPNSSGGLGSGREGGQGQASVNFRFQNYIYIYIYIYINIFITK